MKSRVPESKLKDAADIKAKTAVFLAKGGKITRLASDEYTPKAVKIYNPHIEHAEKKPTYYVGRED